VKQINSVEGRKRVRSAWILLAASVAISTALAGGAHAYLGKEKRDAADSNRRLQEARARVDKLQRERKSIEESAALFSTLVAHGLMQPERRLDLVELINRLRKQHRILSIDYDIAPQRPLALPGSRSFPGVDISATRVTVKARALHEGDAFDFIRALGDAEQAFRPVDRCHFKRIGGAASARQPRIEADCTLEWITMKEKPVA
jgi:hypothetical protein